MVNREKVIDGLEHCSEDGCKGCPYEHDCVTNVGSLLAKDAPELLAPRVLTLQECYEAPFVWIDNVNGIALLGVRKIRPITSEPGMLTISSFDWPMMVDRESNYGKTFRCWNQYPTEEQRKAVKWDE